MQISMKTLALAACAAGAMTMASCGDDEDPIPVDPRDSNRAPTLTIENPDMSMTNGLVMVGMDDDGDFQNGNLFEFTLEGDDPDGNMNNLRVLRDGTGVTAGSANVRVEFNGTVAPLAGNAPILLGDDQSSFSKTVQVRAPQEFEDTLTYTFIVTDTFGLSDTAEVSLATGVAPTPLDDEITDAVFYNRSAPAGFGGAIDLDDGSAVPSAATNLNSELQDLGNANGRWLRQVQPENGAELRYLTDGTSADYDNVDSFEGLLALYDRAASPDNDDGNIAITPQLSDGDILVVKKVMDDGSEKFYLVRITTITDGTVANNSGDFYTVDIKQSM